MHKKPIFSSTHTTCYLLADLERIISAPNQSRKQSQKQ
jgi:hypothetical protein